MKVKRITKHQFLQLFTAFLVFFISTSILQAQNEAGFVFGQVYMDLNDDCDRTQGDTGLQGWTVRATETTNGEILETSTSQFGYYDFFFPELGAEYLIEVVPPTNFTVGSCFNSYIYEVEAVDSTIQDTLGAILDFPITSITSTCPQYNYVDIGGWSMRRCFDNTFNVQYCNFGLEDEEAMYIEIELDDFLELNASSIPFSSQNENTYTFDIGLVPSGECGTFSITALLSCDTELGQTHCLEARVFPDTICSPIDPLWSGASLRVDGACNGSEVEFTITNAGDGDMTEPADFIVVEDHVIMMQDIDEIPALLSGESFTVTQDANGSTWRLEVNQVEFHPSSSVAESATVEACTEGTVFSTGFVTMFSENDDEPYISILCMENRGAYDPNEKRAYPKGFGESRFIEANTTLDYVIHFQNTGTDTAFTVVIEDQISDFLNPTTIRTGASSHPYTAALDPDDKLIFTFENIMLPDSNINEAASHGYVKFKIDQQRDLPVGTLITNEAAIFFDFNEPIITNETVHKINEDFLEIVSSTINPEFKQVRLNVGPNPLRDYAVLQLEGIEADNFQLLVFNLQGQLLRTEAFSGDQYEFTRGQLSNGTYLFQVQSNGQWIASGKLIVQ